METSDQTKIIVDLIQANMELTRLAQNIKDECATSMASYREELHSAKAMVNAYQERMSEMQKRIDRLQDKYDSLHDCYVRITEGVGRVAEKSIDSHGEGSKASVNVKI
ncbi:MAG: snapin/pallidin family protein [Prevotella sp.]|nr:snapin/pallidin family protein [Prevotella sp.]